MFLNMCFNFQNIPTGISDCHNLISVIMKGKVQSQQQKNISYRSYKKKKINNLTLVLSEKKILNKTKNHNPPLQVKWSVPNIESK
jgi:hypothetical protein